MGGLFFDFERVSRPSRSAQANDKKGGHLASRDGQLILREAAQCPDDDEDQFQDISKHRYFNTNNLWIDLEARSPRFEVLRCLHFVAGTRI